MIVAVTGGTGFIGRRLTGRLAADGHSVRVLSRRGKTEERSQVRGFTWDALAGNPPPGALDGADAVVHLAGEPVGQRWTSEARRRIRESRAGGTQRLVETLAKLPRKPTVLVSASAVGYYGSRGDEKLDESAPPATDFLSEVCAGWEEAARGAEALGLRVARLRCGLVLGADGGALARMLTPFRWGAGGRLGSGRQWMSWIHADDLVDLIRFALDRDLRGPVNAVAPEPVTNAVFTATLAKVLKRPALFPVPEFALKALFGEMSGMLLDSQRAVPRAALAAGFQFRYPDLSTALKNLLA